MTYIVFDSYRYNTDGHICVGQCMHWMTHVNKKISASFSITSMTTLGWDLHSHVNGKGKLK
eukprot:XP_001704868.1 Hypothetical protein GL50803_112129 [Giardia lamblia ATCC 50803]